MNQVILVGRVSEIHKKAGKIDYLRLKVKRAYHEDEDKYDYIKVDLANPLVDVADTYLKVDNNIGVRCHIHTEVNDERGTIQTIIADKITFISKGDAM